MLFKNDYKQVRKNIPVACPKLNIAASPPLATSSSKLIDNNHPMKPLLWAWNRVSIHPFKKLCILISFQWTWLFTCISAVLVATTVVAFEASLSSCQFWCARKLWQVARIWQRFSPMILRRILHNSWRCVLSSFIRDFNTVSTHCLAKGQLEMMQRDFPPQYPFLAVKNTFRTVTVHSTRRNTRNTQNPFLAVKTVLSNEACTQNIGIVFADLSYVLKRYMYMNITPIGFWVFIYFLCFVCSINSGSHKVLTKNSMNLTLIWPWRWPKSTSSGSPRNHYSSYCHPLRRVNSSSRWLLVGSLVGSFVASSWSSSSSTLVVVTLLIGGNTSSCDFSKKLCFLFLVNWLLFFVDNCYQGSQWRYKIGRRELHFNPLLHVIMLENSQPYPKRHLPVSFFNPCSAYVWWWTIPTHCRWDAKSVDRTRSESSRTI